MRLTASGFLLLICAGTACAESGIDARAEAVITKTRTTHADYSMFAWNQVTPKDRAARDEWSAEFNKGNMHRVETPRDRLVADCAKGTGTYLNLETMNLYRGPAVAKAACGIQANSKILSASYDGVETGPFGKVERLTIHDPDNVRTYRIAPNGAIVAATIESDDGRVWLRMFAVAIDGKSPADIFSEASLFQSAVPEKYRQAPRQ